ncbi:MAG TPA: DNA recombination protein RmuC [Candidatus Fimivicinus intestinavium]|nr:DNA recombination protein RmuC [Candidatus Fimivicinus intestinavium]
MELFLAAAALAVGVAVLALALVQNGRSKQEEKALHRQLESLAAQIQASEKDSAAQLAAFGKLLEQLGRQTADEFGRSRRDTLQYQQALREETGKSLREMSAQLGEMTRANYEHQKQLTQALRVSLDQIRTQNTEQNDKQSRLVEGAITRMQESNEKKLDQMRATVDEKLTATLSTRLDSSFKTVSDQLENLYKSLGEMKELSTGVTDHVTALNRVLTNVKARGTWAEVQLENILDETIPQRYERNWAPKPNSAERVEFAVRLPSGEEDGAETFLPIDSKFPMEDYARLCDAADRADQEGLAAARKALEARVRDEAKTVRKYINEPRTTPFAILYLATEGLYAEVTSSRSGLTEQIQSQYNVLIAGPTTITALLNSLAIGFKAVTVNEKAKEVRELLAAAKAQYGKFSDLLEKARKKIDEAGRTIGDAQNRSRLIQNKLRKVESLEPAEADRLLQMEASGSDEEDRPPSPTA